MAEQGWQPNEQFLNFLVQEGYLEAKLPEGKNIDDVLQSIRAGESDSLRLYVRLRRDYHRQFGQYLETRHGEGA